MGLRIETWNIAYRKRAEGSFRNTDAPFTVIPNGHRGWYADPFLFDFRGETYLFAEFFSYQLGRGIISVAKYDAERDCFSSFVPIITEEYHLSYPVVFVFDNHIYMMPECGESRGLFFYRAVDFPTQWEKISVLNEKMRLVDSTPFFEGEDLFCFSLRLDESRLSCGELLLMKYDGSEFHPCRSITRDMSVARPGGNVLTEKGALIRVSQNCEGEYGKSLNFVSVRNITGNYCEEVTFSVKPDSVALTNGALAEGIHTYNRSRHFEVIDLKYFRNSWYRLFLRLIKKG